jgi:cell division protein FtsI/penicillin-binding protein 2
MMLRSSRLNKSLLLAGGAGFALLAHLTSPQPGSSPWAAAQVRGGSIASERSSSDPGVSAPHPASPRGARGDAGGAGSLSGDALLRGDISLDKAVLRGDHYEVPLYDESRALLTLDPTLQKAAEGVLARAKAPVGAIVVMATDGRILALAGRRTEPKLVERAWDAALSVWAPAASIFKLVTAAALVADGVDPNAEVCYHGGLRSVDASNLEDDPGRDGQCGDLGFAVAKSQNALIAKLAHKHLDRDELKDAAEAFGFAAAPTFALDVEPNRYALPEQPLEFARVAAGFWSTELSPLGGALVANVIATDGLAVTPRIVAEVRAADGASRQVVAAPSERAIPRKVARAVADMMVEACESGSARKGFRDERGREFFPNIDVAGKTGSLTRADPSYLHYSWFVGFAPADAPQVSIAVLLGNPRRWHLKASTAARLVLDELF